MPLFFDKATAIIHRTSGDEDAVDHRRDAPRDAAHVRRHARRPQGAARGSVVAARRASGSSMNSRARMPARRCRITFEVRGTRSTRFAPGRRSSSSPWQPLDAARRRSRLASRRSRCGGRILACAAKRDSTRCAWRARAAARGACSTRIALTLDPPVDLEANADQAGLLWSALFHRRTIDASALADDLLPLLDADGTLTGASGRARARWRRRRARARRARALDGVVQDARLRGRRGESLMAAQPHGVRLCAEGRRPRPRGRRVHRRSRRLGRFSRQRARATRRAAGPRSLRRRLAPSVAGACIPACRRSATGNSRTGTSTSRAPKPASPTSCGCASPSSRSPSATIGSSCPVRLPVGWLYQVASFTITDSFGILAQSAADQESERHAVDALRAHG